MSLKTKLAVTGAVAFALIAFLGVTRAQPQAAAPTAGKPLTDLGKTLAGIATGAPGGGQVASRSRMSCPGPRSMP